MASRQNIIVRRADAADTHAESVVRDYAATSRHLHWPRRLGAEELSWQLLAEVGGQPAGRTCVDAVYPPFGELINLHVQPALRGRGVGGTLVDECVASLGRLGFMAVFLQTNTDLTAGHRLYARKGFVLAAKGRMLRLVRFVNLPILDSFLFGHPLARNVFIGLLWTRTEYRCSSRRLATASPVPCTPPWMSSANRGRTSALRAYAMI